MSHYYVVDIPSRGLQPITSIQTHIFFTYHAASRFADVLRAEVALWVRRYNKTIDGMTKDRVNPAIIQGYVRQRERLRSFTPTVRELTWEERETWRSQPDDGIYTPPVWKNEHFWTNNKAIWDKHFPHISEDDPTMLAYTEDARKGEADRQTRIRPGRYLRKFFGDILSHQQIEFYSEWFAKGVRPPRFTDAKVEISSSADEVLEVYQNGPRSCMTDTNAVKVYHYEDHPDGMRLAFIRRTEQMPSQYPKYVARAIIYPKGKGIGRIYPTTDNWDSDGFESREDSEAMRDLLLAGLREMGYVSVNENRDVLTNAVLPLYRANEHNSRSILMPYLDNDYRFDVDWTNLTARLDREGEYSSDGTNGVVGMNGIPQSAAAALANRIMGDDTDCDDEDEDMSSCEMCDDTYHLDDLYTTPRLSIRNGSLHQYSASACENCRDNSGFFCEMMNETVFDSEGETTIINRDGYEMTVSKSVMETSLGTWLYCFDREVHFNAEEVSYVEDEDGDYFCQFADSYAEVKARMEAEDDEDEEEGEDLQPATLEPAASL